MTSDHENLAADFLLGKLSEEETLKLEKDYFSNNRRFEEILAAENDLIDAYAMNTLSPKDRSCFENRLLINPHQRERVQFAKTLFKYASSHPLSMEDFNSSAARTPWKSLLSQFFSGKPFLSLSFSLAALIVFIGAVWLVLDKVASEQLKDTTQSQTPQISPPRETVNEAVNNNQNTEIKPPGAPSPPRNVQTQSSPKQAKSEKKEAPVIYALTLLPGLTRNGGTNQRFNIPPKTDLVKIGLKFDQAAFDSYQAILETVEGRQVWSGKTLKPRKDNKSVTFSIPSKLLQRNDYILTLKGRTKDGVYERVEDFAFMIYR